MLQSALHSLIFPLPLDTKRAIWLLVLSQSFILFDLTVLGVRKGCCGSYLGEEGSTVLPSPPPPAGAKSSGGAVGQAWFLSIPCSQPGEVLGVGVWAVSWLKAFNNCPPGDNN